MKNKKQENHEDEEHECGPECSHNHDNQKEMQSKIMEIGMLENKLKQLEQSLNFVDQQIMELQVIQMTINELKKAKKGQEIMFPLGKNVFIKGKLDEHEILVNIGGNAVVKKNEEQAKEVVERQKLQLSSLREEIAVEMERIIEQISLIEKSLQ